MHSAPSKLTTFAPAGHSQSATVADLHQQSRCRPGGVPVDTMFALPTSSFQRAASHCLSGVRMANEAFESHEQAVGPATALTSMLRRNNWTLHADGKCTGPGCVCLNLCHSGRKQIVRAVHTAWNQELGAMLHHHNGCATLGAIDARATQWAFQRIPFPFQKVSANCLVGGHMAKAARAQWDPLEATCRYCGAKDTSTAATSARLLPVCENFFDRCCNGCKRTLPIRSTWPLLSSILMCMWLACCSRLALSFLHRIRHVNLMKVPGRFSRMGLAQCARTQRPGTVPAVVLDAAQAVPVPRVPRLRLSSRWPRAFVQGPKI